MMRWIALLLALLAGTGEVRAQAFFGTNPPTSGASSTVATGSTTARTLGDRAAERLNVRDYGAVGDGVTDDSAAFTAAINAENTALTAGTPAVIYVPAGKYLIKANHLPRFGNNLAGAIVGEGQWKSVIIIDPTYVGDLFAWSDAWLAGTTNAGVTSTNLPTKLGPRATGLSILGDQAATSQQNAFVLYDHNDFAYFNDIDVNYLHGRAFYAGGALNDTASYMRESHITNFRAFNSGMTGVPVFELTSTCTASCPGQDATNEIDISGVDIYGSRGPSFVIRNAMPVTGGTQRQIRISRLRVEGTELNPNAVAADLVTIGDAAMAGLQTTVTCVDCELVSPYVNFAALRYTSQTAASMPTQMAFQGAILAGAGAGFGLKIDTGKNLRFQLVQMGSVQTNVTVASSATTGGPIYLDGGGQETTWTYALDVTALQYVRTPSAQYGVPTPQSLTTFRSAQMPSGDVNSGNNRGVNSTDWQTVRFNATQVASAPNATISGGTNSTVDGTDGTVSGGNNNRAAGLRSTVAGGFGNIAAGQYTTAFGLQSYARNFGAGAIASGQFTAGGDAQMEVQVARGSGATASAFRMTADGSAASSTTNNCVNLQNAQAYNLRISLHARDFTTAGTDYDWMLPTGMITRDASAATTAVSLGTPVVLSRGTVTGAAVTVTADTTLGCLNLSFAPPTGNTDTWHVVARVETVEVQ